jgi:hypothetical protein
VSSIGGISAFPNTGAYHASKWALEGLSQSLAQEVAGFGIKVTLIEPSGYATDWAGPSAKHATVLPAYEPVHQQAAQARARRFRPGDPAATRDAVLRLVDTPPRRCACSSASRRWASRPRTTRLGSPPGGNGNRWPSPPRATRTDMTVSETTTSTSPEPARVWEATRPENHIFVLFGATGDLAARKLLPGLFHLAAVGLMPDRFRIIGSSRRPMSDERFRELARRRSSRRSPSPRRPPPTPPRW